MIDAAIVGLGRWGRNLVGSVQGRSDRIRFVAGVARRPEAAREAEAELGFPVGTDYAAVLADPAVRAVVLATPHSQHVGQVIAAARAGKAVFCEKPLALSLADARRAVSACSEAGVVLAVGQDKRLWPSMTELKRIVAGGELGRILHVEGNFSNQVSRAHISPWREVPDEAPGASMTATGIHVLDAFVNLLGPVRNASARLTAFRSHPDPLDTLTVMYEFACGASGVLCGVRTTPYFWRVHVFGEQASAAAMGDNVVLAWRGNGPPSRHEFPERSALRTELELFADAVEGRAPFPIPTSQMLQTISAFEATARSLARGCIVEAEPA